MMASVFHRIQSSRFLLLCLGLLGLMLGLAMLLQPRPTSTGSLALPDGSVVRIIGATYGTNHAIGHPLARIAARLPAPARGLLTRVLGPSIKSTITTKPTLVVWLEDTSLRTNTAPGPGYFDVFLADGTGFVSGDHSSLGQWWANPQLLIFHAIPRRDPKIAIEFFYHLPTGKATNCGRLYLENPLYKRYAQWQPETLPATRRTGDVEMIVRKLSTGHSSHTTHKSIEGGGRVIEFGTNRFDGRNTSVCLCAFRPLRNTNEVWCIANEEVSDATGNCLGNTGIGRGGDDDGYFTFEPGLWPSEAAWRLNCEIKRVQGFAPEEMFRFDDVPLGGLERTNQIGWTTNFNGASVMLHYVVRRAPSTNEAWSSAELSFAHLTVAATNGVAVDLLSSRTDRGTNLACPSWSSGNNERDYHFRAIPLDANTVTFTFAVQRTRRVEFTLKPEVGSARAEVPQGELRK
jgi:hypothetical protein